MLTLLETTSDWTTPNHIYLVDDDRSKLLGFIRKGTKEIKWYDRPLNFDKRNRTFEVIQRVKEVN
jgi:hypothetical protein